MAIYLSMPVMMFMELDVVQQANVVLSAKADIFLVHVTVFY